MAKRTTRMTPVEARALVADIKTAYPDVHEAPVTLPEDDTTLCVSGAVLLYATQHGLVPLDMWDDMADRGDGHPIDPAPTDTWRYPRISILRRLLEALNPCLSLDTAEDLAQDITFDNDHGRFALAWRLVYRALRANK